MVSSHLRTGLAYPFRPAPTLRGLVERGAALRFAFAFALLISVIAGLRAALMSEEPLRLFAVRFVSSLFGFVVVPLIAWGAGRLIGGRAGFAAVAAAVAGAGVPFIAADLLWSVLLACDRAGLVSEGVYSVASAVALAFEWASIVWALVLLVPGFAEAQGFSRLRAASNVALVLLGMAALAAMAWGMLDLVSRWS